MYGNRGRVWQPVGCLTLEPAREAGHLGGFAFRYNARFVDDGAREALAIKGAEGKRLLYREPVGANTPESGSQPRLI